MDLLTLRDNPLSKYIRKQFSRHILKKKGVIDCNKMHFLLVKSVEQIETEITKKKKD